MFRKSVLLAATVAAAFTASPDVRAADNVALIEQSEQRLLAAEFDAADALLVGALADASGGERLSLLLQRLRVGQGAQLSGAAFADQAPIIAEAESLAAAGDDPELAALTKLRATTSRYFAMLAAANDASDLAPAADLVGDFQNAADNLIAPCPRANALFFAALIPQVLGDAAGSKTPLEDARVLASQDGCLEELAYIDRHLAAVAEEEGDLKKARALNASSVQLRREMGTEVFLAYALVYQGDLDAKAGDKASAEKNLGEALKIATARSLPSQRGAACETAKGHGIELAGCAEE
ncbi:MAG: hypothetical protein VX640_09370 [Pseudomonadota bacterium]|nr:hypothetical protein [Pseudomonadota bacterium]